MINPFVSVPAWRVALGAASSGELSGRPSDCGPLYPRSGSPHRYVNVGFWSTVPVDSTKETTNPRYPKTVGEFREA